jgi:hypothetical protein
MIKIIKGMELILRDYFGREVDIFRIFQHSYFFFLYFSINLFVSIKRVNKRVKFIIDDENAQININQ